MGTAQTPVRESRNCSTLQVQELPPHLRRAEPFGSSLFFASRRSYSRDSLALHTA
jgi:hypothetical protein